jgi:hypothetical protein
MGEVIDFQTREILTTERNGSPIDAVITQLATLRDDIACCIVVLRYKDGIDDWFESDILLSDTRIALATFMLNESTKNMATYLMLEDDTDDDDQPA